jgi:lipopolysaccharide transport system ATP-binding protein
MSEIVIKVEDLGKFYRIGARQVRYPTLRETLVSSLKRIAIRKISRETDQDTLWALRNVSFEINQGEVLGVIGRNSAGKSTLLKLLAHITEPSEGRVSLFGRVGSLLEVGTGFHPELTGRDNIYLNGAVLGMKRTEIGRKFDEIVDFAGIEKFLDTPVKRYSSGMYVRLAFAVAAHLEPEILLVDEVLAVGDAQFQKKCLGKMSEVAHGGRTVLFVSHNMAAIQNLCTEIILLNDGKLVKRGDVKSVVGDYLTSASTAIMDATTSDLRAIKREGDIPGAFVEGYLNGKPLAGLHSLLPETSLEFELHMELADTYGGVTMGVHFEDDLGVKVYSASSRWALNRIHLDKGSHLIKCVIEKLPLVPGRYNLLLACYSGNKALDRLERIAIIDIVHSDVYGTGEIPDSQQGYFLSHANWTIS